MDENGLQNERRSTGLQNVASKFLVFALGLSYDLSKFSDRSKLFSLTIDLRGREMNHFQRLNEVKELKLLFFAQRANTRKQASSRQLLPCDALAPTAQYRASARYVNDTSAHRRPAAI